MADKNLDCYFKIRVTEKEKEKIRKKAQEAQLTMSDYARRLLLEKNIAPVDKKLLNEIKMQIRYIGNNINQSVRIMNMYHDTDEFEKVYSEFLKLKKIIEKTLI